MEAEATGTVGGLEVTSLRLRYRPRLLQRRSFSLLVVGSEV